MNAKRVIALIAALAIPVLYIITIILIMPICFWRCHWEEHFS